MAHYPEIQTLADITRFHAARRPEDLALVFEGRASTYAELDRHCSEVANGLQALGCRAGSRVGYLGKNSDLYFEVLLGCMKAGAVMVPLNWRLTPRELEYIIEDASLEVLFSDHAFVGKIAAIRPRLRTLRQVLSMDDESDTIPGYGAWRAAQSAVDPRLETASDGVALQLYTSGTTGHPKGVQLPHRNFYVLAELLARSPDPDDPIWEWNVWGPEDSSLLTMPCFHISGTGWGIVGLYNGARNVVLREFDAEAVLDAIQEHRISKLILVPTAIQMVIQHPKSARVDFSSLKYLCYGASPIPLDLLKQAIDTFHCQFIQMYGLTETTGAVTFLPAEDHDVGGNRRMRSAGRACYGVEIKVADDQGRELERGESGEIYIRSDTIMRGYWNLPEETAAIVRPDGWLRSGDAGYMDEDGYVFLQDRVKDMIVSGGVNIYPVEIENAMYEHPAITAVAVIGVPDDKWGEAVKAIVVLQPGTEPDEVDLLAFARERLADFKVPKSIDFVTELPYNASGKVLKRELRNRYWQGKERQIQ